MLLFWELGCALDQVDSNIDLLKDLEQARIKLFIEGNNKRSLKTCEDKVGHDIPDSAGLQDILSDMDDGFMDLEESNLNRFQLVSSKKKIEEKRITRYFFW